MSWISCSCVAWKSFHAECFSRRTDSQHDSKRIESPRCVYETRFVWECSMRRECENLLGVARSIPVESLPALAGELETIRVTILARLASPPVAPIEERLLDIGETAKRLACS